MTVANRMPYRNVTLTIPQSEFIDAEVDRLGITASEVVRRAMDFYLEYKVTPELMKRVFEMMEAEGRAQARPRREGIEKPPKAKTNIAA